MITLDWDNVEIDLCIGCKSIWLDSGELEILLDLHKSKNPGADHSGLLVHAKDTREKLRKCPICTRKMEKVCFRNAEILLDRCKHGCGIWFDRNELEKILSLKSDQHFEPVAQHLGDIFTKN
jgi:Zn-finger nucleic acid-binding protein